MGRMEMIETLIKLVEFVEGEPEVHTRPIIEGMTDEKLADDIEFYSYVADK